EYFYSEKPRLLLLRDSNEHVSLWHLQGRIKRRSIVERIDARMPALPRAHRKIAAARVLHDLVAVILDRQPVLFALCHCLGQDHIERAVLLPRLLNKTDFTFAGLTRETRRFGSKSKPITRSPSSMALNVTSAEAVSFESEPITVSIL